MSDKLNNPLEPFGWSYEQLDKKEKGKIRIVVGDIAIDPTYQPRFKMNEERIQYFRELLRDGEKIPAILVGQLDERYVVIDGSHRLLAVAEEGIGEIEAVISSEPDENLWLLQATRLNDRSALPLSTEEIKEAIRRTWRAGCKDTKTVA